MEKYDTHVSSPPVESDDKDKGGKKKKKSAATGPPNKAPSGGPDAGLQGSILERLVRKTAEPEGKKNAEDAKPDAEAALDTKVAIEPAVQPQSLELGREAPLGQVESADHGEFVTNLQQLEPMKRAAELINFSNGSWHDRASQSNSPAGRVAERVYDEQPDVLEDVNDKNVESEPNIPAEQPPAREADTRPIVAESGGGNSEPPPPRGPESSAAPEPDPEQPPQPAETATMPEWMHPERLQQAEAVNPSTEQAQPVAAANQAAVPPHGHRQNNGAVLGLAAWETWRHHRMNSRNRRIHAKQEKRMKQIEHAQAEARDQQYRNLAEQTRQQYKLQQEVAARPTTAELRAQHPRVSGEHLRPAEAVLRMAAEKAPALRIQIAEEQPVVLPPEHRVVSSEWHNIEVDKSGHAVEAPVLAYGREFQREQHQEARRQDQPSAAAPVGGSYSAANTPYGASPPPTPTGSPPSPQPPINVPLQTTRKQPLPKLDTTDISLLAALLFVVLAIIAALTLR